MAAMPVCAGGFTVKSEQSGQAAWARILGDWASILKQGVAVSLALGTRLPLPRAESPDSADSADAVIDSSVDSADSEHAFAGQGQRPGGDVIFGTWQDSRYKSPPLSLRAPTPSINQRQPEHVAHDSAVVTSGYSGCSNLSGHPVSLISSSLPDA